MDSPDIDTYIQEAENLEKMYLDLLEGTTQRRMKRIDDGSTGLQNVEYRICVINSKNELLQSILLERYNSWYDDCHQLIQKYAGQVRSNKYESFTERYDRIISLIDLEDSIRKSNERNHLRKEFISCLDSQVSILHLIKPHVALNMNYQQKINKADKLVSDLEEAESLCEKGLITSACDMAGCVLERYIAILCEVNGLETSPEDSIVEMAQKLYESNNVYEFDSQMLQTIEYLSGINLKCANFDSEIDADTVQDFIDKIREITFLVFW
ncbi:hypothetical protein SAMN04488589_0570 [Methanolobus vulcani]|uniref:Uncharacterized protein n=1 Tax=Methanolobus vulcani TaxID=38026 RepID=A0A7Z7FDH0_9EURY|nr:hypothetical protein [Methanolobus vulcani]SDF45349.1 hypothetical protein SAMN04488589_0570 [Methanolobus vulcani]